MTGRLGSGGAAEVYRAETAPVAGITRPVAIKRILNGVARGETAFLDETRIWVKLSHPNIVAVLDFGEEEGDWFLALELVEGVTAAELVRQSGALPVPVALTIVERVARALDYAHALEEDGRPLHLVHRDVKPANILLSTRGETKLTDFGIARAANRTSRTAVGIIKGSASTLSPEQVREEPLDARSDLFALGATLHFLLVGAPLFDVPIEKLLRHLEMGEIPSPPAHLPPKVRQLLQALTAAERDRRPASASDVAKAIRIILAPTIPDDVEPEIARRVRIACAKVAPERASRTSGSAPGAMPRPAHVPEAPSRRVSPASREAEREPPPTPFPPPAARAPSPTASPEAATPPVAGTTGDSERDTARSPGRDEPEDLSVTTRRSGAAPVLEKDRTTAPPLPRRPDRTTRPSEVRAAGPPRDEDPSSESLAALLPPDDGLAEIDRRPPRFAESPSGPDRPVAAPAPRPRTGGGDVDTMVVAGDVHAGAVPPSAPSVERRTRSGGDDAGGTAPVRPIAEPFELPAPPPPGSATSRFVMGTSALLAAARRPSKKALGVFALAVTVLALIVTPEVFRRMTAASCAAAPATLAAGLARRGALAVANEAAELEQRCPPDAALRSIRLRALAFSGDTKSAWSLLPPAPARAPEEQLAAVGLLLAERNYREAESAALRLARDPAMRGAAMPSCLAAAAQLDQDEPARAEETLRGASGDCVRILRAAAATQVGERNRALSILRERPAGSELRAAHESAVGVLHLLLNEQDAANADALAALGEARRDTLRAHPFVWYTTHSPRGGGGMSLRVTGPMDDPVLYAMLLMGDAARARGNLDLAFKHYDDATARGGRTAIAEVRVAAVLAQQGKPQLARGRLTRAISIDAAFAPAHVQLALLDEKTNRASAAAHAAAALKLEPENRDARRIAGR